MPLENLSREEMIRMAEKVRSNSIFPPVCLKELQQFSVRQKELNLVLNNGKQVHIYELRPETLLFSHSPLIVNFHGGGFIKGRGERDQRYCSYLSEKLQCLIWDVDYCLAPEHPFPSAVEECYSVAVYAFEHAEELGIDRKRIAIAGHSAGGNLAAAIHILDSKYSRLKTCALLMEYFPADHTMNPLQRLDESQRCAEKAIARAETELLYQKFYCTKEDAENPLCSPVKASSKELIRFPDCLVISAGKDSLRNETEQFAQKLVRAGVTVTMKRIPEAIHGFTVNWTEGWESALKLYLDFFSRHFFSDRANKLEG